MTDLKEVERNILNDIDILIDVYGKTNADLTWTEMMAARMILYDVKQIIKENFESVSE